MSQFVSIISVNKIIPSIAAPTTARTPADSGKMSANIPVMVTASPDNVPNMSLTLVSEFVSILVHNIFVISFNEISISLRRSLISLTICERFDKSIEGISRVVF